MNGRNPAINSADRDSDSDKLACKIELMLQKKGAKVSYTVNECQMCAETPNNAAITLLVCSQCKQVAYCCVGCQRAHWKVHKSDCRAAISK